MSEDIIFQHNLICIFLHMNLNEHFFYLMAGVAQLVERWIVIPRPPSNISDLAPKAVRPNCVQIERREWGILVGGCLTVKN